MDISTAVANRKKLTAAQILTKHGYSITKTETRANVTVRTWTK